MDGRGASPGLARRRSLTLCYEAQIHAVGPRYVRTVVGAGVRHPCLTPPPLRGTDSIAWQRVCHELPFLTEGAADVRTGYHGLAIVRVSMSSHAVTEFTSSRQDWNEGKDSNDRSIQMLPCGDRMKARDTGRHRLPH